MNIYDKKSIHCYKCDRFIGEIDCEAVITLAKCGRCASPIQGVDGKMSDTAKQVWQTARIGHAA